MSSKRTAGGFKKAVAAASGGQGQLKQTTLFNFVRVAPSSSPSGSNPRQETTTSPDQPAPVPATRSPSTEEGEEDSPRARKGRLPAGFNFSKEASKENRPPPQPASQAPTPDQTAATPSRPLQPRSQSQDQTTDGNRPGDISPSTGGDLIRITDIQGDLFSAPPNTVLIHACNSIGSWGGGIALAFKKSYPEAFKIYAAHCRRYAADPRKLVGTALLIPPPPVPIPGASNSSGKKIGPSAEGEIRKQHWIGCLFTSKAYGRGRDPPREILRATAPAMRDLMKMIAEKRKEKHIGEERGPGDIRMCHINSGLFDVPWAETKRVVVGMRAEDILEERDVSEVLNELGDLPVHIEAYWRPDMQPGK